jgi:hypothetical protein
VGSIRGVKSKHSTFHFCAFRGSASIQLDAAEGRILFQPRFDSALTMFLLQDASIKNVECLDLTHVFPSFHLGGKPAFPRIKIFSSNVVRSEAIGANRR